jgi:hypothetical protein
MFPRFATLARGAVRNNDGGPAADSIPLVLREKSPMALNKKQKKQIDSARKKQAHLRQLLAGAKQQMDDPAEVERLKKELAQLDAEIEKIQEE